LTTHKIIKPVLIIGAARSGTTMMGQLLCNHPDIAYWNEPNHIWKYGHAYRYSDVLRSDDVKPEIRTFIYKQFSEFLQKSGKNRFMEKTPSNCFRLPYIMEIFPDARFLHIIRDGRDVTLSAMVQWKYGVMSRSPDENENIPILQRMKANIKHLKKLLETRQISKDGFKLYEIPFYLDRLKLYLMRSLFPGNPQIWGPRFPGIEKVFNTYTLLETCAIQWDWSVRSAVGFGRNLNSDQYLEIKYEEFLKEPEMNLNTILDFLELDNNSVLYDQVKKKIRSGNATKWPDKYNEEELKKVMAHIGYTLKYLGYK